MKMQEEEESKIQFFKAQIRFNDEVD